MFSCLPLRISLFAIIRNTNIGTIRAFSQTPVPDKMLIQTLKASAPRHSFVVAICTAFLPRNSGMGQWPKCHRATTHPDI